MGTERYFICEPNDPHPKKRAIKYSEMTPDVATPTMVFKDDIFRLVKQKRPTVHKEDEEEITAWEVSN